MTSSAPVHETVASSDGVDVVIHHLASGPADAPIVLSHATGFHARAYRPMAAALAERFDAWGHDARGHGSSPAPPDWVVDWRGFGDDATAVALWLATRSDAEGQLVGFGHSMGGAALLMAAHRHPSLFRALVLFEPIVFPPTDVEFDPGQSPLAVGARRRRREFDSYDAAIENYRSKRPMNAFDAASLDEYVYGGFRPVDPDDPGGRVELTCTPEFESDTFGASHESGLWPLLPAIATRTLVVGGPPDPESPPSMIAEAIGDALPNGEYRQTHLDHFGPFVDPPAVAALAREFAG